MAHKITVIGGANADIAGAPSSELKLHESNIGKISISPGGVGRNIACELRDLGEEVSLITAFGDDAFGNMLKESCRGIDISSSLTLEGRSSSTYLYVTDETGDMYTAVNDMDITDEIRPPFAIDADAVVIDANIPEETIAYVCGLGIPVYADPVSAVKAVKLIPYLDRITAVKPNEYEYEVLGDACQKTFVSRGSRGIRIDNICVAPPEVFEGITNGCGDAATAAIVFADLSGMSIRETAEFAVKYACGRIKKK